MNWSDRYPALQKIFEKFQKMWLFAMTSVTGLLNICIIPPSTPIRQARTVYKVYCNFRKEVEFCQGIEEQNGVKDGHWDCPHCGRSPFGYAQGSLRWGVCPA